jgi:hypothetical protein
LRTCAGQGTERRSGSPREGHDQACR